MIRVRVTGSSGKTEAFLSRASKVKPDAALHQAGREGVAALRSATPVNSGLVARSWGYEVKRTRNGVLLTWTNSDIESGFPVAIMLQYGYATGTGGYVSGRDYINPAIKPIFDKIADRVWREVTNG